LKLKKIKKLIFGLSQLNKDLYKDKSKLTSSKIKLIIEDAIDKGINCFDTATNYGNTQEIIGKLEKSKKNKIAFFSKGGFVDSKKKRDFSKKYLKKILDFSLKKMKIETLDVFFLNKPTSNDIEKNDLLDFFYKEKKSGNILKGGIIVGQNYFEDEFFLNSNFEYYSILFNLINTSGNILIKRLKKNKKKIITRSPFNSGVLSRDFLIKGEFKKNDYRKKEMFGVDLQNKKKKINYIIKKYKLDHNFLSEISLSFLLSNGDIDHIIYGPSKLNHSKKVLDTSKYFNNYLKKETSKKIILLSNKLDKKFTTNKQFV
tara:strand:+ start:3179 stop:4123 length:945 start_codon:yes stop_codon:yes gene_type:complete